MDSRVVGDDSSDRSRSADVTPLTHSQNASQKRNYNEEAFGKLGVDAVVFTINTIQIAKAKIRYYWPSDEAKKSVQSFIKRRPVLSSFLGLQLASITPPALALLTYASCSAIAIAIGALLSLLTALGLGLCVFLPTVASAIFITSLVWLGGYSMYLAGYVTYTLYTEYFRSMVIRETGEAGGREENHAGQNYAGQRPIPQSELEVHFPNIKWEGSTPPILSFATRIDAPPDGAKSYRVGPDPRFNLAGKLMDHIPEKEVTGYQTPPATEEKGIPDKDWDGDQLGELNHNLRDVIRDIAEKRDGLI